MNSAPLYRVNEGRLPDTEWKFDSLTEKDDALARGIFLDGYFRHSEKLRELVLRCRQM